MADYQVLNNKRARVKGSLTRISNMPLDEDTTLDEIQIRIEKLDELWAEFHDVEDQMSIFSEFKSSIDKFESDYFHIKSKLRLSERKLNDFKTKVAGLSSIAALAEQQKSFIEEVSELNKHTHDVHLPKLQLDSFSGNYNDWPTFKDMYTAAIHNTQLSDAQKLQHLKNLLKGPAATTLKNTKVTDANYAEAWEKVLNRYDRKRYIVYSYISEFCNIRSMTKPNAVQLRSITDAADEHIRGIQALGEDAENRDHFLIYIILHKLDSDTRDAWARKFTDAKNLPTWRNFITFLENRCDAFENSITLNQTSSRQQLISIRNHISTANRDNCLKCDGTHKIYECVEFKALSAFQRKQFAYNNNLCIWCLKKGHTAKNCQTGRICFICQKNGTDGKHHSLLHYSNNRIIHNPNQPIRASVANISTSGGKFDNCVTNIKATHSSRDDSNNFVPITNHPVQQKDHSNQHKDQLSRHNGFNTLQPVTVQQPNISSGVLSAISTDAVNVIFNQCNAVLPTALVRIKDRFGKLQLCRALLDSGSQTNFISEACVQRLQLKRVDIRIPIDGIASSEAGTTNGMVHLQLSNRFNDNIIFESHALILSKLTSSMPSVSFSVENWNYLSNLTLADPQFNAPASIDIIIGAPKFFEILQFGNIIDKERRPCAQNTIFGYVIAGELPNIRASQKAQGVSSCTSQLDLSKLLCKFWEIEELPSRKTVVTSEELECENHFLNTYDRNPTGRFVLKLPFKRNAPSLGSSQQQAVNRLYAMERRFKTNKQLQIDYITFMREYKSLGHMEKIHPNDIPTESASCFYLPHHAVIKESTTTKVRVVFDGSARSSNGIALNDILIVGPVVQPNMIQILLKFRLHLIAFSADIAKMYRQMLIESSDTNFQRIVWRESEDEPIQHYKLKTVTYGLSCAPYQATRSLKQIAIDCKNDRPKISKLIEEHFYVDDLLSGTDCVNEAICIYENLIKIMKSYGLQLRKWKSNSIELLSRIPNEHQEVVPRDLDKDISITKILGLQWSPEEDNLLYKYTPVDSVRVTKRTILSEVSRLFDPIGLLSPVVIKFKILLQSLWIEKSDWDDQIPPHLLKTWNENKIQLCEVEKFKIPRCIKIKHAIKYQLIGFSDASETAYGAAIYLKSIDEHGKSEVHLVTSKSRVAPLKVTSIPRLELNAAVVLSRLITFVKDVLKLDEIELFAYSDSTTVLSWLAHEPYKLKTYVANRTEEIISLIPPHKWRYVKSQENPADYVSRGVTANQLLNMKLWWHGPEWLQNNSNEWPNSHVPYNQTNVDKEIRKQVKVLLANPRDDFFNQICNRFSSYNKLIKFNAAWFRIIKFLKDKVKLTHVFTATELREAEKYCIKRCQMSTFSQDITHLTKDQTVHKRSNLLSLHPFIDHEGLLRVGGRLARSTLPYDEKHPLLLPQRHIFCKLLMLHYHHKYLHAGPTLLASIIKRRYWIIRCKDVAKLIVNRCLACFKYKQKTAQQLMGNVPKPRVEVQIRPFIHTGLDYAGPINLKVCKGRSKTTYKAYIVVYVCLTTKALTIDLVTDLTSESFIASLQRFISRRRIPHHLYSDNSTTFIGANKQLQQLFSMRQSFDPVLSYLSSQGITWHFIPPLSPHIGGMWEASVRSIKFHLKRVLKDQLLCFEELITFLLQIESVLNSRPLCCLSEQPEEFEVLTPAHFLIGETFTSIPEESLESTPMNRLSRFQRITKMKQSFWHHWHKAYLNSLQHRPKWKRQEKNMKEGDLVIVKEDDVPPGLWIIAQITKTYPGEDNNVRVVDIRTSKGTYKRSITKLVKIPKADDDDEV